MDSKAAPRTFAVLLFIMLFAAGVLGSIRGEGAVQDLCVTDLSIEGSADGVKVKVEIMNEGTKTSDQAALILRDEFDPVDGSSVQIARLTVPSLEPGRSVTREIEWSGIQGPTHRIWAIADIAQNSDEVDPWNNVRSSMVELPRIESIGSPFDGDPDPGRIGTAFSGVAASFPIEVRYSGLSDHTLVRVYYDAPEGASVYAQTDPDGVSRFHLDLGAYPSGINSVAVRVSVSKNDLDGNVTTFACREVPQWIVGLDSLSARFDGDEGCYIFTGTADIPEYQTVKKLGSIGREVPVSICPGGGELQFTVRVLTDMTTTIEYAASVRIEIGQDRHIVRMSGTAFAPSPDGPLEILNEGTEAAVFELQGPAGSSPLFVDNGLGGEVPIIELPDIRGNVSAALRLTIQNGLMVPSLSAGISMGGNATQNDPDSTYGLDHAVSSARMSVSWNTSYNLTSDLLWEENGKVNDSLVVDSADLGFSTQDGGGRGIHGFHIIEAEEGNVTYVAIPQDPGSNRSVVFFSGDDELMVHASNVYKSDPVGVILPDGRAIVAWTEGWYSSDWKDAYGALRVRCSIQESPGGSFSAPTVFGDSTTRSAQLIDAGDGEAVLLYITDPDDEHPYLTMSYYDGSSWSAPVKVGNMSTNGPYDAVPDGNGGITAASFAGGGVEISRTGAPGSQWTLVNGTVLSLSLGISASGRVFLAYSTADPIVKGTNLFVREVGDTLGQEIPMDRSDGIIGQVQMRQDPDEILAMAWTDSANSTETVKATVLSAGREGEEWLLPLSAKTDPSTKLSFSMAPLGKGQFAFGWLEDLSLPGRGMGEGVPYISVWDMSNACDITGVTDTLEEEYIPGQTFVLYADLKGRGLGPASSVQVDLMKVVRESSSGNLTTNIVGSKEIEVAGEAKLEFPVTISENQIGLYLVCGGPGWSGPDHVSTYYVSLPAVANPGFSNVDFSYSEDGSEIVAEASLINEGASSARSREVFLMGSAPTLPMVFPGHSFEPARLRPREGGTILNRTEVILNSYEGKTVVLRAPISPGVRLIWLRIECLPWEGNGLSEAFVSLRLPAMQGQFGGSFFVRDGADPIGSMAVENYGHCTISELPYAAGPTSHGLTFLNPTSDFTIELMDEAGLSLESYPFDVSDLEPGSRMVLDASAISGLSEPSEGLFEIVGSWDDRMPLSYGSTTGATVRRVFTIPPPPSVALSIPEMGTGTSTRAFTLKAFNDWNRSIQSAIVVLYNGMPSDGVVVSSALIPELAPNSNASVAFSIYLPEGRYLFTVESYVPDGNRSDGTVLWRAAGIRSGEYNVKNQTDEHDTEEKKVTDEDVQRALILAGGMGAVIVVGALANRAVEESRREK